MTLDKKLKRIIAAMLAIAVFVLTLDIDGIYSIKGEENTDFVYDIQTIENGKVLYTKEENAVYYTNGSGIVINTSDGDGNIAYHYTYDNDFESFHIAVENTILFENYDVIYLKAVNDSKEYQTVVIHKDGEAPDIKEIPSVTEQYGIIEKTKEEEDIKQHSYYTNADKVKISIKEEESGILKVIRNTQDNYDSGIEMTNLNFSDCEIELYSDSDTYLWLVDNCGNISMPYCFIKDVDIPEVQQIEKIAEDFSSTELPVEENIYTNKEKIKITVNDNQSGPEKLLVWTDSNDISGTLSEHDLVNNNECILDLNQPVTYFAVVDKVGNGKDRNHYYTVYFHNKAPQIILKKNNKDILYLRENDDINISNQSTVRVYSEEEITEVIYSEDENFINKIEATKKNEDTGDNKIYYEINNLDAGKIYYVTASDRYGNKSINKIMYTNDVPAVKKFSKINSDNIETQVQQKNSIYWVNQDQIKIYVSDDTKTGISKIVCGTENNILQAKPLDDVVIDFDPDSGTGSILITLPDREVNYIWIYNGAGNYSEPVSVRTDKTDPAVDVLLSSGNDIIKKGLNYRTNRDIIELSAEDKNSGIDCIKYTALFLSDSKQVTNDTNDPSFNFSLNIKDETDWNGAADPITFEVWCIDNAGNESERIYIVYDNDVVYSVKQGAYNMEPDNNKIYVSMDSVMIDTINEGSGIKSVQMMPDAPQYVKIDQQADNLYTISGLKQNEEVKILITDNLDNVTQVCIEYVQDLIEFTLVNDKGEEREHDDNRFYTNSLKDKICITGEHIRSVIGDKPISDELGDYKNAEGTGYEFGLDKLTEITEVFKSLEIMIRLRAIQEFRYVLVYDTNPPELSLKDYDGRKYVNDKTTEYITIKTKDDESGIAEVYYYTKTNPNNTYPIKPDENGNYKLDISEIITNIKPENDENAVYIVSRDKAGNRKQEKVVIKYDNISPRFKTNLKKSKSGYISKNDSASIDITEVQDNYSGIKSVKYCVRSKSGFFKTDEIKETIENGYCFNTDSIIDDIKKSGEYEISIIVTDQAGNEKSGETYKINVDVEDPQFRSEYVGPVNWMNGKQKADISITKIKDSISGIKSLKYYLDKEIDDLNANKAGVKGKDIKIKDNTANIDVRDLILNKELADGKHKIQIIAEDKAGNQKISQIYEIKVDTTEPQSVFQYKINEKEQKPAIDKCVWLNGEQKAEILVTKIDDKLSKIKSVKYIQDKEIDEAEKNNTKVKGKILTISENKAKLDVQQLITDKRLSDGEHRIQVITEDNAGNQKFSPIYKIYVDTSKPSFMSKYDRQENEWINGEQKAEISITGIKHNLSKIKTVKYFMDEKIDEGNMKKMSGGGVVLPVKNNEAKVDVQKLIRTGEFKEGIHPIAIMAEDNAGNLYFENHTIRVDTIAPGEIKGYFGSEEITWKEGYDHFFSGDTQIQITAKDITDPDNSCSGLAYITLELRNPDGSSFGSVEQSAKDGAVFDIPAGFKGDIYASAKDHAGNVTEISKGRIAGIVIETSEMHDSDFDITIRKPQTSLRDRDGNELYRESSIPITIEATDNLSGIRNLTWSISSSDTSDSANQSGEITITGGILSGDMGSVDVVEDRNGKIITHLSKTISVTDNSNNIVLNVTLTDNAGHTRSRNIIFSNDITPPFATVSYDNNTPDIENIQMFNQIRTATISVTERNFDPDQAVINITSTDYIIPVIGEWSMTPVNGNSDDFVYTAEMIFSADGDYEFNIALQDMAGNAAQIDYGNSAAPQTFTVDRTRPVIICSYDNNNGNNYFKDSVVATITVTEHNFSEDRLSLSATRDGIPQQIRAENWSHNNDVHSATVVFTEEGEYLLTASYTDMAGNIADSQIADTFFVDRSEPQVSISGIENQKAYRSDRIGFNLSGTDTYFDKLSVSLTRIDSLGNETTIDLNKSMIVNGEEYSIENLDQDGIYRLSYNIADKSARNVGDTVIFSVNRNGSTYMLSDQVMKLNKSYVKSIDSDIVIKEVNVNELLMDSVVLTLSRGSSSAELKEGVDYSVEKNTGSEQWCEYIYTIKKSCFEEDGIYSLSVSSRDSSGNISVSDLEAKAAELSFAVDKTAPICNIMNLRSGTTYATDSKRVEFTVSDNIMLSKVSVLLNGTELLNLTEESLRQIADSGENILFDIPNSDSAQTIVIQYVDKAGNEGITEIKDFYVTTNLWIRYTTNTPLMVSSIAGAAAVLGLAVFVLMFRKKAGRH